MKIYAIPYAVGNTSVYFNLRKTIGETVDFIPVELPGHGGRLNETLLDSIEAMAEEVYRQILINGVDEEYCLLGYSMGAIVCRETYYKLKKNYCKLPKILFLCACPAPGHVYKNHDIRHCERDDLIRILKEYGGTPDEVFDYKNLLDLILPIAKADFCAVEEYRTNPNDEMMLPKGVIIYSKAEEDDIENWGKVFLNECKFYKIGDNHFFIFDKYIQICEAIKMELE